MIKIKNYIKDGDNFTPIEEFTGTVPDPEYIDSAMELIINGVPIITCREWDYMSELWGYIATGFDDLSEKTEGKLEWTTGFPDQPIDLTFRVNRERNEIEVESTPSRGKVKAKTNLNEFLSVMSEAGQKFFLRMAEIVPEQRDFYKREANHICEAVTKLESNFSQNKTHN